ncbi:hypothetical protein D1970_17755 [Mesobacillus zeae]|uniref:Nitrous oxide reductase n=1 Tax=Mesobacillus zeae TaxID=1917180 RepID=A0A398AYZ1_9BACI|nr:nitrous oxide reductase accessory protein NosL [Mesobacillus zeae]RID82827.1 hypothetical protein D1970_17755 [Mesobacillus zeae]
MKKKYFSIIVLTGIMLILAACGKDEVKPAAIDEATDKCEVCNMAVADGPDATQIVLEDGKSMVFDDIGCMYAYLDKNKDKKIAAEFVRDHHDKGWVEAGDATYVYNKSVKTPMAYNVVSFKDEAKAKKFAGKNEGSTIMTEKELADHSWERNKDMMMKNKMKHHSHSDGMKDSEGSGEMKDSKDSDEMTDSKDSGDMKEDHDKDSDEMKEEHSKEDSH